MKRAEAIAAINAERDRQDEIWGISDYAMTRWLTVLTEEVGELAAAILCECFGNDDHIELDWQKECIQVAAVAVRMLEQAKRSEG